MRRLLSLTLLLLSSCTGDVLLARLQEDVEALRTRLAAREEVKISIAAAEPVVKSTSRTDPSEPHVTVAVPPCPPPPGLLKQVLARQHEGQRRKHHKPRAHRGRR